MTLSYAPFGKLASVTICLIIAASLGSGVSVAKKKPKGKVIPQEKARLVLHIPSLANSEATFIRSEVAGDKTEMGTWRTPPATWPAAQLTLIELDSSYQFIEGQPLQKRLRQEFQRGPGILFGYYGLPQIVGEQGELWNHYGKLEFQRFTLGTGIACVGMRQYMGSVEQLDGPNTPLGDTMVFGWYCAAPDDSLTNEMVSTFVRGIGVKGIE